MLRPFLPACLPSEERSNRPLLSEKDLVASDRSPAVGRRRAVARAFTLD
jgi:hypothetical protein